eukprot:CAMPEP_0174941286 /NCGR_PEP_ID=MMETSP1355-20121228/71274_1 /TAXON_ID=464990 /ORGANISM="Hemiselmis tepida, Strain CCMP443" /LENGTH=44 /DNA_ID= /DNA_START= /DNA_END= /DNA_ORIENTATION=
MSRLLYHDASVDWSPANSHALSEVRARDAMEEEALRGSAWSASA